MELDQLHRVRFAGDTEAVAAIRGNEQIAPLLEKYDGERDDGSARKELLGTAVRVNEGILPDLGTVIDGIHRRAAIREPLECYVYAEPYINASVVRGRDRLFVLLSSAAIEKLNAHELEFVIGHEIGHVVFDHFEIPVRQILGSEQKLPPRVAFELLSWQRQAEISADRAGLLCCGSLDVSARAFFKVLSGLSMPGLQVDPLRFASQFDHLRDEIFRRGGEELATMTHPLPPLRMKSMSIFWESRVAAELLADASGNRSDEDCDREIRELLAFMDPLGRRTDAEVDPILQPFLLWSGLMLAGCDFEVNQTELTALAGIVGNHTIERALQEPRRFSHYQRRLRESLKNRRQPLSALDINRIFTCLIAVVRADGRVDPQEIESLHELAATFGVAESYVDGLLDDFEGD